MNIKKILALVLCMVMCVSMFPVEAFAADDALPEEKEQTEEVQTGEAAEAPRKEAAEEEPGAENVPGESAEEEPDTAEEPAEDTIFAPAEAEESADEPIPVEFKCQPEEAVITVYSKDEKDETRACTLAYLEQLANLDMNRLVV